MKVFEQYSDLELVQKIVGGETELFEMIIRRNNPFLYKVGRSYNYTHEDTQDLMQDTYVDAFTHLSGFESRSSFKTWIIKIMLNNCFRKKQKWSSKHVMATDINDQALPMFSDRQHADTNSTVMNKELSFVIENALQNIPVDYRIVFTLREMNGLNVAETAESLQISESNVKARLSRAKSMLRKEVEKSYSSEEIFEFNLIYCNAMVDRVMKKLKEMNV